MFQKKDIEHELRQTEHKLFELKRERTEVDEDKQDMIKTVAALEMVVKDLEDLKAQSSEAKVKTPSSCGVKLDF